jgi:hypothetical protein
MKMYIKNAARKPWQIWIPKFVELLIHHGNTTQNTSVIPQGEYRCWKTGLNWREVQRKEDENKGFCNPNLGQ